MNGDSLFARLNTAPPASAAGSPPTETTDVIAAPADNLSVREKLGPLVTLDVKSNEIRGGVTYIAQVLKRNKTLKVLNLSDNKIDSAGLTAIAHALKVNKTLETLDLSQNPCCGPLTGGMMALKEALAVNTALKRLYLSSTGMTAEGAVLLSEALHEAPHILQIDLTGNRSIGPDGLATLAVGMRANNVVRCLDVTLDYEDSIQAEIGQALMQCCIRNTEAAVIAREGQVSSAVLDAMWAPIRKSTLVRLAKQFEERQSMEAVRKTVETPAAIARNDVYTLEPDQVVAASKEVLDYLAKFKAACGRSDAQIGQIERQRAVGALEQAKALLERVGEFIQETEEPVRIEQLLAINDGLAPLVNEVEKILAHRKLLQNSVSNQGSGHSPARISSTPTRRHMKVPSYELDSPNFFITNSDDDDSDAEELSPSGSSKSIGAKSNMASASPSKLPTLHKKPIQLNGLGLGALDANKSNSPNEKISSAPPLISTVEESVDDADSHDKTRADLEDAMASTLISPSLDKCWLEEEAEIFRKGVKLGVADEIDERDDKLESGNELKQKVGLVTCLLSI